MDAVSQMNEMNMRTLADEHSFILVYPEGAPEDDSEGCLIWNSGPYGDTQDNKATADDLGISELVVSQTSYFYGSSGSRANNIRVAASRFHGLLIAPGETFSVANVLGDVSLDTGFSEALIIFGDRTIKGVGGGVCQVSTTLFRGQDSP